jgi:two-component system sensor histidine kinase SenX3
MLGSTTIVGSVPVSVTIVTAAAALGIGLLLGVRLCLLSRRGDQKVDPGAPYDLGAESSGAPPRIGSGDPRVDRALDALPIGVVVTDGDGVVVYRNRFSERFDDARHSDALVEAAINELIADMVRPPPSPSGRGAMGANGNGQATATPGPDAAGTVERHLDLYGPPARQLLLRASTTVDDDGPWTGCVVLIEDETAAQRLDRVRRDFVANVSHELRTPVGAMSVLAETLVDADDPEIVARLSGRLHREALRLSDIIEDLLTLSRLDSAEEGPYQPVDLVRVAQCAVDRCAEAARQHDLIVHGPEPESGPVVVVGDQGQLQSAVGNLLDNAVKYTDVGGEITVGVSRDDGRAQLTVNDTGVGIPEADLDRIFERFYRVDGARSRETGGTGLGLSIVRHVVLNHGGEITVRSVEGQGSTFVVTLPVAERLDSVGVQEGSADG